MKQLTTRYEINFETYELAPERYTLVDVRSPGEYEESTITGAVNIPLFSDFERKAVGTVYKEQGKAEAVRLGVSYVSRSLERIYESFEKLTAPKKKFLIFCARGGMRSEAVAGFVNSVGLGAIRLEKGYKAYRNHILEQLPLMANKFDFVTLYGKTGTGKTQVLKEIEKLGGNILDLEAAANHRGSVFGSVGLGAVHSQKRFETMIYDALKKASGQVLFAEGESRRIGKVYIPDIIFEKMEKGKKILIEAKIPTRVRIIREDYLHTGFTKEETLEALSQLVKYIGHERIKEYTALLDKEDYDTLIEELMLRYYDLTYNTKHVSTDITVVNERPEKTAGEILKSFD